MLRPRSFGGIAPETHVAKDAAGRPESIRVGASTASGLWVQTCTPKMAR